MCFAKVYEQDTKSNLLTTTDVSGNYAVTSHPNGSDHTWEVYLDGTFAQQIYSTPADLDGFPADGGTDYDVQATGLDQRAIEAYYLMNYVRLLNQSAWSGMPVYSPAKFQFSSAQNPCNGVCCNSFNGEVTVAQAACAGIPNSARTEQAWRWLVTHETGHLNFPVTGGDQSCGLCVAANEGLADVQAYVANRVEWLRSEGIFSGCGTDGDNFAPDRIYQADECTTQAHDTGNIFAGVYLDLYYELGWRDALARMLRMIDLVGSQTKWQDNSGSDSFYEHTLAADFYFWDIGAWQHTIGAAWKRHDDRDTDSSFDWRDQLPGSANPAFQIPVPSTGSFTTYTNGPDSFLPRLAIDFNLDRDYFWVQTFAGETYTARTWNLCSGVDPQLEWIRIVSGAESVIATSDDCADTGYGNNQCLVVKSGSNGWAALRVRQEVGDADTGCYDFEIKVSDDAGDTAAASRAIANNGEWLSGTWGAGRRRRFLPRLRQ